MTTQPPHDHSQGETCLRSIAVAQTVPVRGDVDANLEQHIRLAEAAAQEGAQVVLFPELSLTGYELDLADSLAFSIGDPRLAPLLESAHSYNMILIAGAPVRLGLGLCIGAFIVRPERAIELYTKHHLGAFPAGAAVDGELPPEESTVFAPGDRDPLIRVGSSVAALAVCADTGQVSHAQHAADRGATTYLASMFVIPSAYGKEAAALGAYAVQHSMAVACANFGGPSGGLASAGASTIWSEEGVLLTRLEPRGLGVAVALETHSGWSAKAVMLGEASPME